MENIESELKELNDLKIKIGKEIFDKRNKSGWSRQEFLEYINISLNALSSIENGNSLIKVSTLKMVTNAFGISLSQFFEDANL